MLNIDMRPDAKLEVQKTKACKVAYSCKMALPNHTRLNIAIDHIYLLVMFAALEMHDMMQPLQRHLLALGGTGWWIRCVTVRHVRLLA